MVATSGARLIAEDAAEALTRRLFPLATVITPNIPEAMALLDYEVDSERTQQKRRHAPHPPLWLRVPR